ncbi:hypothetical protein [Lachnoanaerobaculum gingivalis]|jgi:hypothetical protein
MYSYIWEAPIWNALTAIGTLTAVILSLYLANRDKKIIRKLHIAQQFRESYSEGEIYLFVTIENVGNVPIILSSYGRKYNENNTIMKDIQEFLDGKDEFIMIKPNEAKVVTYKYNFGSPFKKNDAKICNSPEYKLFTKAKFKFQDTLGNFYQ